MCVVVVRLAIDESSAGVRASNILDGMAHGSCIYDARKNVRQGRRGCPRDAAMFSSASGVASIVSSWLFGILRLDIACGGPGSSFALRIAMVRSEKNG